MMDKLIQAAATVPSPSQRHRLAQGGLIDRSRRCASASTAAS